MGHVGREGNQQEHTADEGRIEDILSKASESHLCDSYGDGGTDQDYPPRCRRRQVQGKQDSGDGS